jgi:hypothetical protein
VLGLGSQSRWGSASRSPTPSSSSSVRSPSPEAPVTVAISDEGDPWLTEVDASKWLIISSTTGEERDGERAKGIFLPSDMADESEAKEEVVLPRYKKGKFGIFASAGYNRNNARGRH